VFWNDPRASRWELAAETRLRLAPVFRNDARQVIAFGVGLGLHVGAQYCEAGYKRG